MPQPTLLDETEAAIKLGITKELLYAYVRNAPKKHLGHERKLPTIVRNGKNLFEAEELESFDKYLWEAWSDPKDKRPEIPAYIKDFLKTEIGGSCPITGKGSPLDNAHIADYATSLSHHHHNLIRIAKDEHSKADSGIIDKAVLQAAKDKLIAALRLRLKSESELHFKSFTPPNPQQLFVGRSPQLSELIYALDTERLIVIEGLGGIGKTELLLNAIQSVRLQKPLIWIDVESAGNLKDMLIFLKTAVAENFGSPIDRPLVDTLRNEPVAVAFDSLEKLLITERDEVEDLLKSLMVNTRLLQIIITSQINLSIFDSEKKVIRLHGLEPNPSTLLLKQLLPEPIQFKGSDISWIMEFCNGHPLTIKLFSSLIKFFENIADAIEQVSREANLAQPLRLKHTKATSLDICFSTIYNCLSLELRNMLLYIKCFPAGLKVQWVPGHLDKVDYKTNLAVLKQFFFLETFTDTLQFERVHVPNPVKPFLRIKEHTDPQINFEKIQTEYIQNIMVETMLVDSYYVEAGIQGPASYGIERLENEFANILEASHQAQQRSLKLKEAGLEKELDDCNLSISAISSAVGKFCFTRGYFEYGIQFAKAGIAADVESNRLDMAAINYMYLAQLQGRQFDFKGEEQTVRELEQLAKATKSEVLVANSHWARGRLEMSLGRYSSALTAYQNALRLIENSEHKDGETLRQKLNSETLNQYFDSLMPGNIALIKSEIAKVHEFSGSAAEAIPHYREALHLQQGFDDEANTYSTMHHLGICLIETSQDEEGITLLLETVEGFYRNKQYEYLANSVSVLGRNIIRYPRLAQNPIFTDEVVYAAVENLFQQMEEIILRVGRQFGLKASLERFPSEVFGKFLFITMFMSFHTQHEILLDFIVQFVKQAKLQEIDDTRFTAMVNLSQGVSIVNRWKDKPYEKQIWMDSVYKSCLILNGGPDVNGKTPVFQWLAAWLDRTGIKKNCSPEQLFQEAWNSLKN